MKETAKGTWVTERFLEKKKQEFVECLGNMMVLCGRSFRISRILE